MGETAVSLRGAKNRSGRRNKKNKPVRKRKGMWGERARLKKYGSKKIREVGKIKKKFLVHIQKGAPAENENPKEEVPGRGERADSHGGGEGKNCGGVKASLAK